MRGTLLKIDTYFSTSLPAKKKPSSDISNARLSNFLTTSSLEMRSVKQIAHGVYLVSEAKSFLAYYHAIFHYDYVTLKQ